MIEVIRGQVVAADIGTVEPGTGLSVRQEASNVSEGGEAISLRVNRIS